MINILVLRSETDNTQAQELARQLQSPIKIYNFVKDSIKYKQDTVWQSWRTPDETLNPKVLKGDCVDKTLLAKSMLDTIGIQNRMIIKYKDEKHPEAHIYNQIMLNGYWVDFDGSCTTCTLGWSFAHNWETIAIIYNNDTIIFNDKRYNELMEA